MKSPRNYNGWKAAGIVSAIGVDFGVCTLLGFYGGKWLSDQLGGNPLWTALGIILGVLTGAVTVIFMVKKLLEDLDG